MSKKKRTRTPLPKPVPDKIDWHKFKANWGKSIIIGVISALVFLILICLTHFLRYGELNWAFIQGYALFIMLVGVISIGWKQYFFGEIYLFSAWIGFVANCLVSFNMGAAGVSSKVPGYVNLAILLFGFLLGIIMQLLFRFGKIKFKTK